MIRLKEALADLKYYGFKSYPKGNFEDDGTNFYMYVWDPEDTGKSPFYFSRAGGYGDVFFGEHIYYMYSKDKELRKAIREHGYDLDRLNGVSRSDFNDKNVGKLVKDLKEIRASDWFKEICPEFAKDDSVTEYNSNSVDSIEGLDKDHQRMVDIAKKAKSNPEKMISLASRQAASIKDLDKMRSRWQAAVDIYGDESPIAKAFQQAAEETFGKYKIFNIKPREGDIDLSYIFDGFSSLHESRLFERILFSN
jgi:hypothetical protein